MLKENNLDKKNSHLSEEKPLAKKSLGQHFLKNEKVIARIIKLGHFKEGEQIMEIGPGPGALTHILRELPYDKLWLIEKDDIFAQNYKNYALENNKENLTVFHMDALTFDWKNLQGDWKIIGNLPYNIASPLMWDIVSQVPTFTKAVFMIQKEVAQRVKALHNNKAYGTLSAWIQSFCSVEKGFVVTPSAFMPPPKVDSEVIVLKPLPKKDLPADAKNLAKIIKICFQQRRKQLHGILQKALPHQYDVAIWEKLNISMHARAENLSPKDFQKLTALLFSKEE